MTSHVASVSENERSADVTPTCEQCGLEITTGMMAALCPQARNCCMWPRSDGTPEGDSAELLFAKFWMDNACEQIGLQIDERKRLELCLSEAHAALEAADIAGPDTDIAGRIGALAALRAVWHGKFFEAQSKLINYAADLSNADETEMKLSMRLREIEPYAIALQEKLEYAAQVMDLHQFTAAAADMRALIAKNPGLAVATRTEPSDAAPSGATEDSGAAGLGPADEQRTLEIPPLTRHSSLPVTNPGRQEP